MVTSIVAQTTDPVSILQQPIDFGQHFEGNFADAHVVNNPIYINRASGCQDDLWMHLFRLP
jgi:hypothetical protein